MIEFVTLEGPGGVQVSLHETDNVALSRAEGLVGSPRPREVVRPRPGAHGSVIRSRYLEDRSITLEGEVWGSTLDEAYARWDEIARAFQACIPEPRPLRFRRGGRDLVTDVRLAGATPVPLEGGGAFLRYQAALRAADPRVFGQAWEEAVTSDYGGGGSSYPSTYPDSFLPSIERTALVQHDGSIGTPPVLVVSGEVVDPVIRLVETGEEIRVVGTVPAGQTLEVDVAAGTVKLQGTNRLDLVDLAASQFFDLPPGASGVRLFSTSADETASVVVRWRPAFL